jgi:hypothetical protein
MTAAIASRHECRRNARRATCVYFDNDGAANAPRDAVALMRKLGIEWHMSCI